MHLLRTLIRREIADRYLRSAGGLLWAILMPLLLLGIYAFVFTQIFQVRFQTPVAHSFVSYLALGLWPWIAISESVSRAATAITDNEAIIGKVALPHQVLIQSSVAATFSIHCLGFLVVLGALAATGQVLNWAGLPWIIWTMALAFVLSLGLAYIPAATQVFIKDVVHALPPLLMLWFFATPILYPEEMVPERYQSLIELNPLTPLVRPLRDAMLGSGHPLGSQDAILVAFVVATLLAGRAYFRRLSTRFEDYL